MDRMKAIGYVLVWIVFCDISFADERNDHRSHCRLIELSNTWFHRSLEGVYELKGPAVYNCNNRSVYQLKDEESYLFYVIQGSWQGWMVGKYECVNKGYLSVGDRSEYPDNINTTWEEFNSLKWLFNKDIISGCHIPGVTRPPRLKTKPPKIDTEKKFNVTTSAVVDKPTSIFSDRVMLIVVFVAVPIGCLVILSLLVILCILAGTQKSFLKRLFKDKKTDKVYYDGKQAKINEKLSDSRRGHQRMVDSAPQEETDSVLEVDAQPEEASGAATTTPPVWSP